MIFVLFIVYLIVTVPMSVSLKVITILPNTFSSSFATDTDCIVHSVLNNVSDFPLLTIPVFILTKVIVTRNRVSRGLFSIFICFVKGEATKVPYTIVVAYLFCKTVSNSTPTAITTIKDVAVPLLVRLNCGGSFSATVITITKKLKIVVPPDVPFVVCTVTANRSIDSLFLTKVVPKLLVKTLLVFCTCCRYGHCKRSGRGVGTGISRLEDGNLFDVLGSDV